MLQGMDMNLTSMRLKRDLPETHQGGDFKGIWGLEIQEYIHWIHTKSCTKSCVRMSNFLCGQNESQNDWCDYEENMVD